MSKDPRKAKKVSSRMILMCGKLAVVVLKGNDGDKRIMKSIKGRRKLEREIGNLKK